MLDGREVIFSKVFLNEISVDRGRSAERIELELFHDLEHSCCLELLCIVSNVNCTADPLSVDLAPCKLCPA